MSLRDLIESDAAPGKFLLNTDDFAEKVVYRATGESDKTITALVYRDPLTRQTEDRGRSISAPIAIEVHPSEVKEPAVGDQVKLVPRRGTSAVWMPVTEVEPRGVANDSGLHLLGVGR